MTDPVIRALDASDAHLFDTMPDPLDARGAHRLTRHRPEWKRIALRDGVVVARGAWWGGPDDSEPVNVNWFDVLAGEEEAGVELLRSAPWQVELELNPPGDWREVPALRAATQARFAAARGAGYDLLAERFLYRWTPECGLPGRPGRLDFRTDADDSVFFDALRRIHSGTLDAHALMDIEEGGLDRAAQSDLDFFHWCPSPREWWQLAYTPRGELAGVHIPVHNPSGPSVGFIGVLPEHRGHGYAYDLLAECTHFLVERGAEFVSAATDRGNHPMAANFGKAGYPVVRERSNFRPPAAGRQRWHAGRQGDPHGWSRWTTAGGGGTDVGFEGETWYVRGVPDAGEGGAGGEAGSDGADIGEILIDDADFPWLSGRFRAGPAFGGVEGLFVRELALAERDDAGHWDEWEAVCAEIERRVRLVSPDGPVAEFLLHIQGERAWFRWSDEPFTGEGPGG